MSRLPDTVLGAIAGVLEASAILQPDSAEYEQDNHSYFSAFENELDPSVIAKPNSAKQVQDLIKALRPHIIAGSVQIAIRGSGQTPFAGSANIDNGVTIDLRGLKGITLSEDKSTVAIGVGETWANVYAELEQQHLTTPGGRVARLGVSGFILGGGLSMFSARYGFACDSVVEFEVVLPSGEIVRANADERADLWIALKGGLNNFGVVTCIKMKTIPSRNIWGGVTYYMPGTFSELLKHACDFTNNETDEDAHIMCSAGYVFGHQAVSCVMYHTEGKENPPALRRFTSIEPQIEQMCTMRTSKHLEFTEELSRFSNDGQRQYWATITIKPDISLMETFHDKWQETLATIQDAEGFIFSFGFHPLTKALLENSEKAGAREKGLLHRYIFTNYGYQKDDIIAGYGEKSVTRLRETRRKYDPEDVFSRGVPGGFKLPNKS
ncbi:uncharacterized protein JN550_005951 [Neoarthrinium moseri]|uniref:uncharacterized protein n=1 Tax=Neoarthrinium moseri TaxID=1658444 RepID=UPI001FDB86F9|nr:uncharacterized protein JN550_005951 [Neoarthrinium moseri]KAI1869321.1 hypothetical protein JN550_005951 [Neoarthrinium moseri]